MVNRSEPHDRGLTVAVVGGGASGTLTTVQLLRRAAARGGGLRVVLIDQYGRHGRGVAYSTEHDAHLLNAVASQMSAFADDPQHLIRWANAAGRECPGQPESPAVTDTTFLPRATYGRYLRDVLAEADRHAQPAGQLTRVTAEVLAIRRNDTGPAIRVVLGDGHLDADAAVLAVGNTPAALPFDPVPGGRVITDPWRPGAMAGLLGCVSARSVVIVGTGLTMLDLAVAITAINPDAVVHAVSRHGMLPRPHPGTRPQLDRPVWPPAITRTSEDVRLADLISQVRTAIAANPAGWHDVLGSLRPYVPGLWRRMPAADKRAFLRHLARYWEVHRHLVPPPTASRIADLRRSGRLEIHRGRVQAASPQNDRMRVLLHSADETIELEADWLVNGTGGTTDISATPGPLLRDLFRSGLARPDPLRLGIDASTQGAVVDSAGAPSNALYTLGPPLRGLWYDTTAIPEIRQQAAALARLITSDEWRAQRRPDSAA